MKHLLQIFILGSLLGLPSFSGAISRIGGGKVRSNFSLFEADLSFQYRKIETGNEVIKLYSLPLIGMGRSYNQGKIFLAEFKDIFPDFTELTRDQVVSEYLQRGFTRVTGQWRLPSCVEIFYKASDITNQYVLTWGNGRGFQINLTYDERTQQEGLLLIESIALEPGACAWK